MEQFDKNMPNNFPTAKFKFTKKTINDAGETLAKKSSALSDEYAWEVFDYWRSLHQTPLHYIANNLTRHARKIDRNALVVRRLKRAPSIFSKLNRESDLTLRKMQDIGGCRVIVTDLATVKKLSESFQASHQNHTLERIKDYIASPKISGYRGIHLIYKFQSNDPIKQEFNGLRVEIQLRTKHQHVWATAVEIVGVITRQSLKSSQGGAQWIEFFKFMSKAMAFYELKEQIPPDTLREIMKLEKVLNVRHKLSAYRLALEEVNKKHSNFFILELNKTILKIRSFKDKNSANEDLLEAEKRLLKEIAADVVLIEANSFHELKKAYPNYFGDSKEFLKVLTNFLDKTEKLNNYNNVFSRLFKKL